MPHKGIPGAIVAIKITGASWTGSSIYLKAKLPLEPLPIQKNRVNRLDHKTVLTKLRDVTMGGHPYWYFVPYQDDIQVALDALRQREFQAGRYNPAVPFPSFPVDSTVQGPGAQHASIGDALSDADADGTRSILDLCKIGAAPGYGVAAQVPAERLKQYFGTAAPTRAMIENCAGLFEDIERGQGIYIVAYKDDRPDEFFFAGYSFD